MDEILEYEKQLAEVQEVLKANDEDEIRQLESELKELIAELRTKLPKFAVNDEVCSKALAGKVIEIAGPKMYRVQPYSEQLKPEGDVVVLDESALRARPLARAPKDPDTKKTLKGSSPAPLPGKPTDSSSHAPQSIVPDPEPEPADEFEASKAKWKKFASKSKISKPARDSARVTKHPVKSRSSSKNF